MSRTFAPAVARPVPKVATAPAVASRGATAGVPRFMATTLGAGASLSSSVKGPLERSFGADLGGVRVHTENSASRAADAVGAKAFAFGSDIVLSSRASANDLGLMAHETAHVLQQSGGPARVQTSPGARGCGFEREADYASAAALRGDRFQIALSTGGAYPQFGFWSTLTEGIGGLIDKAIAYIRERARSIPGYDLLAVAIGKDPLTQAPVDRTATNIIKGLLGLIPGGAAMFENLQKSGVIQRAADWVEGELKRLNLTWDRVSNTIKDFIGTLGASDLLDLGGVLVRAVKMFGPLVRDIVTFAAGAAEKLFEFIFEGALSLAGSAGQMVLGVLRKAGAVIKQIIADPIGFLKNLLAAVFGGFKQFGTNILNHLKTAIFEWLFGAMAGAGIVLPKKFDFQGIVSIALQVLGLTWQNMRGKLVKVLGEPVVAGLEKTFEFIKLIVTQGVGAAWQKILEFATGMTDTIIEGIKSWVAQTIVGQAILKIVSMANPVGALIQSIIAIYNTVMFVIERAKQIMAFVTAVTDSLANIAAGRISAAINYVEQTLARILPLVISFLARFIGLGGISAKIKEIIAKLRAPIDKAIDKIIEWVVKQAKALAAKVVQTGRGAVAAVTGWWRQKRGFTGRDKKPHTILVDRVGSRAVVKVRSKEQDFSEILAGLTDATKKAKLQKAYDDIQKDVGGEEAKPEEHDTRHKRVAAVLEQISIELGEAGKPTSVTHALQSGNRPRRVVADPLTWNKGNTSGSESGGIQFKDQVGALVMPKEQTLTSKEGVETKRMVYSMFRSSHVLASKIHGPAAGWNLANTGTSINSQMREPEDKAKELIDKGAELRYVTTVEFHNPAAPEMDRRKLEGGTEAEKRTWLGSFVAKSYSVTMDILSQPPGETLSGAGSFGPFTEPNFWEGGFQIRGGAAPPLLKDMVLAAATSSADENGIVIPVAQLSKNVGRNPTEVIEALKTLVAERHLKKIGRRYGLPSATVPIPATGGTPNLASKRNHTEITSDEPE